MADGLRRAPVIVGVVVLLVTALTVIQVRSQAEVARSLEGQDNTSLAFLIDDLHRSNDQLAQEELTLSAQRDVLRAGGTVGADAQLAAEAKRLRIIEGLDPVSGPGVTITIDAALNEFDLQDAVNNLRLGGAEAVAVAGRRVVTGTVIQRSGSVISIDGEQVHGPWILEAIGDPAQLAAAADQMTRTLRADPRVRSAGYQASAALSLVAVVTPRPFEVPLVTDDLAPPRRLSSASRRALSRMTSRRVGMFSRLSARSSAPSTSDSTSPTRFSTSPVTISAGMLMVRRR
jgi:uncharacterized protein YlxW (UPF0749 family)